MLIGQRLGGKYEIQAEIGRGGMGVVYRGFDVMLQRTVAVKVLPREFTYDPQFVQRFRQEAVMAAGLHHPGIVTIHDVGEQDGVHYIVMQFLEGVTLDQWLVSHGPMPLQQTNYVLRQIAEALDYAHTRGIVHRDIKPSNIMIGPANQATVMDFGLVRAGEGTGLTRSGTVVGTPEYMAPEQALGQSVDGRTDIYSLGVVLYKMLTGQVPFSRSTSMAVAYAHVHEPPPLLRQLRVDVPRSVEAVVFKALGKRPEERYQQAGQLADHFTVAITGKMPTGLKAAPTPPPGAIATAAPVTAKAASPASSRPAPKTSSSPAAATQLAGYRTPATAAAAPQAAPARRPLGLWLAALGAVLVLVVVGAVLALRGGSDSSGGSGTPAAGGAPAITLPSPTSGPAAGKTLAPSAATAEKAAATASGAGSSPTRTPRPPTAAPAPSATRARPTATPTRATALTAAPTPAPTATATRQPATATRIPPTNTPRPKATPVPTRVPPTNTPVPPTEPPPPPTEEPPPEPTNTPMPEPTNTPIP